jgi:hypothetical protein
MNKIKRKQRDLRGQGVMPPNDAIVLVNHNNKKNVDENNKDDVKHYVR